LNKKAPTYGGQALIEGVAMRGPRHLAMSVRRPSGEIVSLTKLALMPSEKGGLFNLPIMRGALAFWDSLSLGMEMLMKSAEIAMPEEETPSKSALHLSLFLGVVIAVAMFVLLPTFLASVILRATGMSGRATTGLVELVIRLVLLVGYVLAISRMQEIQRVLQYHGAEHKVLWAWENNHAAQGFRDGTWDHVGVVNTLADVAKDAPRLHPRCGTSFLFLVAICSWVVYLFVSPPGVLPRVTARILLLPLVAGLSYEVLKLSAGRQGVFWRIIAAPGMALQILTTREPDTGQLEVAAESLAHLIEVERGDSA
jgi:uncharacterized protein YqhQ